MTKPEHKKVTMIAKSHYYDALQQLFRNGYFDNIISIKVPIIVERDSFMLKTQPYQLDYEHISDIYCAMFNDDNYPIIPGEQSFLELMYYINSHHVADAIKHFENLKKTDTRYPALFSNYEDFLEKTKLAYNALLSNTEMSEDDRARFRNTISCAIIFICHFKENYHKYPDLLEKRDDRYVSCICEALKTSDEVVVIVGNVHVVGTGHSSGILRTVSDLGYQVETLIEKPLNVRESSLKDIKDLVECGQIPERIQYKFLDGNTVDRSLRGKKYQFGISDQEEKINNFFDIIEQFEHEFLDHRKMISMDLNPVGNIESKEDNFQKLFIKVFRERFQTLKPKSIKNLIVAIPILQESLIDIMPKLSQHPLFYKTSSEMMTESKKEGSPIAVACITQVTSKTTSIQPENQ